MASGSPSSSGHVRYTVRSSDVLADMRMNVCKEGSDVVVWYKERFLAENEIIEHLVENETSTIHWTIHRPNRGWYIRVRSPTFPPGVFISLATLPKLSPYKSDAALAFACRTSCPPPSLSLSLSPVPSTSASSSRISIDSDVTLTDAPQRESTAVHSYPPTPPTSAVSPRLHSLSSLEVEAKLQRLSQTASSSSTPSPVSPGPSPNAPATLPPIAARLRPASHLITSAQVTHFLLTPQQQQQHQLTPAPRSFFSRIADALKSTAPARSSFSFNMCAIPPPHRCLPTVESPPPPSTLALTSPRSPHTLAPVPYPYPLISFHDTTPVFTVGNTSGLLEVDETGVQALGVDMSFYVAVALSYLEFLEEREGYMAAQAD